MTPVPIPAKDQITGEVVFPELLLSVPDIFDGLNPQAHFNVLFDAIQETGAIAKVIGLSFLELRPGETHTVALSDQPRALLFFPRQATAIEAHGPERDLNHMKRTSLLVEGHSPHVLTVPPGFWMYLSNPTDILSEIVLAY